MAGTHNLHFSEVTSKIGLTQLVFERHHGDTLDEVSSIPIEDSYPTKKLVFLQGSDSRENNGSRQTRSIGLDDTSNEVYLACVHTL